MSVSVNEINYLIWRYLQESGLEVSAYALEDETTINKLDSLYSPHVPLGCLVDLVQKGILYSKMTDLVSSSKTDSIMQDDIINLNFNFFTALHEINSNEQTSERKILSPDQLEEIQTSKLKEGDTQIPNDNDSKDHAISKLDDATIEKVPPTPIDTPSDKSDFIQVIKESMDYESSFSVSFSPDNSNLIAWTRRNNQPSIIYSFSTDTKIQLPLPLSCKETLSISWSPTGTSLITASENGELRLWSKDGTLLSTLAMHHWPIVSTHWSPNGQYLLSLDIRNVAVVWNAVTGSVMAHLDKESWSHVDKNINELMTSIHNNDSLLPKNYGTDTCWLDDNKFVIPGPRFTLLVCQLNNDNTSASNNGIIGILTGHEESICIIKYDVKLRLLCSASEDGIIRIWKGNSINSLQILTGHSLAISMLEFFNISNKWYLLSTSLDGTIRIWDFVQNELIDLISVDEGQAILCASLYQDKNNSNTKLIATGDSLGSVCIWRIESDNNSKDNIKIRQVGLYQHFDGNTQGNTLENQQEPGFVSEISWCNNGSKVAVSFSVGKSVIIDIP